MQSAGGGRGGDGHGAEERLEVLLEESFGDERHGLGNFSAPGKWFGMKVEINTVAKTVNKYIRTAGGQWVRLNEKPLPYFLSDAEDPTHLFIGLGTRRLNKDPLDNNILEMDNIRVMQLSGKK